MCVIFLGPERIFRSTAPAIKHTNSRGKKTPESFRPGAQTVIAMGARQVRLAQPQTHTGVARERPSSLKVHGLRGAYRKPFAKPRNH